MLEKALFAASAKSTHIFKYVLLLAYWYARGDAERVHELALEAVNRYADVLEPMAFPHLRTRLAGRDVLPFGTAAGMDKNADALGLSRLFGFLEVGTVVVEPRLGNPRPRVIARSGDLYNAQGFPSKGLAYARKKLAEYNGSAPVLASICGIPAGPDDLESARGQLEALLVGLGPYAHGFVWNPFSPNTGALKALRTPAEFRRSMRLVRAHAGTKPALIKMGPYHEQDATAWLALAEAGLTDGADGLVVTNTLPVSRAQVPAKHWGYPSAGRSGRSLQPYRDRAVCDARRAFPGALIIATGGIDSPEQAWRAFESGADALEGYTPYTYAGLGLVRELAAGVQRRLQERGYATLRDYQTHQRARLADRAVPELVTGEGCAAAPPRRSRFWLTNSS